VVKVIFERRCKLLKKDLKEEEEEEEKQCL
jgi:hypothetical protein